MSKNKVNIRPNVSMLSVLRFLEYETWFALAEYVDNAIDSYNRNKEKLIKLHGKDFKLKVDIEINDPESKITIRDNAAGIEEENYARAFRAAEIPEDTSGLSEFGMGMKSASCWFSDYWVVRTTAIGEDFDKTVKFDMNQIFEDKLEELEYTTKPKNKLDHYTVIELSNVTKMPRRKGLGKVKSHLASIYRQFIRDGLLILKVDSTVLEYVEPNILRERYHKKPYKPQGDAMLWKKDIDFDIDDNLSVKGFVAIREKASTNSAGFALFRRGRVIEGSFDNGFRPDFIFGAPNSYRYQRVFGELHLIGFDVSFTKKGIQWDENLDVFLQLLKDDINNEEFPLLKQAENYRVRASEQDYQYSGKKALKNTVSDLEERAPKAVEETFEDAKANKSEEDLPLTPTDKSIFKEFQLSFNKLDWNVTVELSFDPSLESLIDVGPHLVKNDNPNANIKYVGIRLSLTHPFMVQYVGTDNHKIEPVLRYTAALGLAEIIAKESGSRTQGEIRRNFNQLITKISIN